MTLILDCQSGTYGQAMIVTTICTSKIRKDILAMTRISTTKFSGDGADIMNPTSIKMQFDFKIYV